MAIAITRLEMRRIIVRHDGKLICRVIPQIVAATQAVEPDIIAFIGDNRNRVNIAVILFVRAVNHADTRTNSPLTFRLCGANCGCGKDAKCQKFEFGHNP